MAWFYGDDSRLFWNWVGRRNGWLHDVLYSIGVWLQNLESRLRK